MSERPKKLTVSEVAAEYRRHEVTVRIALQNGALHGSQPMARGKWLIEEACAEAWSNGEKCAHMIAAEAPRLQRAASARVKVAVGAVEAPESGGAGEAPDSDRSARARSFAVTLHANRIRVCGFLIHQ